MTDIIAKLRADIREELTNVVNAKGVSDARLAGQRAGYMFDLLEKAMPETEAPAAIFTRADQSEGVA